MNIFSKVFVKAILIVMGISGIYFLSSFFVFLPKVQEDAVKLEESLGKAQLSKISLVVDRMVEEIEVYKNTALETSKNELRSITDIAFHTIERYYSESQPDSVKQQLESQSNKLKKHLDKLNRSEKNKKTKKQIREIATSFISMYTFYKNGKFQIVKKRSNGSYTYQNFKTGKVETVGYSFYYSPLNIQIATEYSLNEIRKENQEKVVKYLKTLKYGKDNYFYAYNKDNKLISHPYLQGTKITDIKDIKDMFLLLQARKKLKNGEVFHRYWWKKQNSDKKFEKLVYIKDFPQWNWTIVTGVYIDEMKKEVERKKTALVERVREILKETVIGKTGYPYILNSKGDMVIHPSQEFEGKNVSTFKIPGTQTKLFYELVKSEEKTGKLYYKWNKPTDSKNYTYDKVSWTAYNEYFDWYIVASAYLDEINETSISLISYMLYVALIILFVTILFGVTLIRKLTNPIEALSQKAKEVEKGDLTVRCNITSKDEIGTLSLQFNKMLDRIEDDINRLDEKVNEKVSEIREKDQIIFNQSKLASMGEMIGNIAHQWRQPLNSLSLIVQVLKTKIEENPSQKEDLKKHFDNADAMIGQMSTTIDDFRNFFKENKEKRKFKPIELINKIKSIVTTQLESNLISLEIEDLTEQEIYGSMGEVEQVVINIINNAKDKILEEREKDTTKKHYIKINLYEDTSNIIIDIEDSGGGIQSNIIEKIFEPYFTTKFKSNGTGIGLYMSKTIIEKHMNGKLTVKNGQNGAIFTLLIPFNKKS
ncbi:MAG: cache domain-containing protein [Campylobacterales bacterium]|nr:cache domain-containing protein [Campylobacterales bacterium]